MSIQKELVAKIKEAMKSKDKIALTALRSLKSAFMLAKTESGFSEELTNIDELKIVQKQVKQRKDSAKLYVDQGRFDLAESESKEAEVLSCFLPEELSDQEIAKVIEGVIAQEGSSSMADMGNIMGIVSKELAGQASGKKIASIVKSLLS